MHRQQNSTVSYSSFVAFGLVFRDADADQRAGEAADRTARAYSAQGGDDRAGGYERTDSGNGQGADALEPAEGTADNRARTCSRNSALGGFSIFLVSEVL